MQSTRLTKILLSLGLLILGLGVLTLLMGDSDDDEDDDEIEPITLTAHDLEFSNNSELFVHKIQPAAVVFGGKLYVFVVRKDTVVNYVQYYQVTSDNNQDGLTPLLSGDTSLGDLLNLGIETDANLAAVKLLNSVGEEQLFLFFKDGDVIKYIRYNDIEQWSEFKSCIGQMVAKWNLITRSKQYHLVLATIKLL